ncbi:FimV/HubP family polar landmark protein [Oceanobacter mangrovi]|uniref:FimV/HubP family polar landmark protein n=1 Tax=Oceanobacter mangrovi TaxID=2862510 RepID=UPI001C8D5F9A|nr:FimV/HubP family polar landmark protein [Oceanobacter mangrovi]
MKRLFSNALLLLGSLVISSQLMALGLGELTLKSALNQPLKAEIGLIDSQGLSDWEIKPALASQEVFERSGVDRSYFLTKIKFTVVGDKIELTTKDGVTEPFLNFLVELNWPSGRVVREFTVLLDPPTFEEESYQPLVSSPSSSTSGSNGQAAATGAVNIRSGNKPAPRQPAGSEQPGTYTVQPNDTLWAISLATRPAADVTPQQMMVAIQRANPEAFIGGNINRLKTFQVLRIPAADQISTVAQQTAIAEVARQNDALAGVAQIDATGRGSSDPAARFNTSGGEVRLVTPSEQASDKAGASGDGKVAGSGKQAELENELAIALENLDKSRRDNADLAERLASLEEQIAALQRLMSLKDDQLASMQANSAAKQSMPEAQSAPAAKPAMAEQSPAVAGQAETAKPADAAPAPAAKAPEAAKPEQVKRPKAVLPPPPPPSLVDQILLDPLMAGGLLVVVLLLLGLIYVAVKKRLAGKGKKAESAKEAAALEQAVADLNAEPEVDENAFAFNQMDEAEETTAQPDFDLGNDFMDDDAVDVSSLSLNRFDQLLEEVDEHIAYGRFDDAKAQLQDAIDENPESGELSLKLLEVYAELDDEQSFADEEARLQQFGDSYQLDTAESMRARLSRPIAPFAARAGVAAGATALSDNDFDDVSLDDLDMEFQSGLDDVAPAVAETSVDESEDFTDFLEGGLDFESALDHGEEESVETSNEFSLDFDLDSGNDAAVDEGDADDSLPTLDFDLGDSAPAGGLDLELGSDTASSDETDSHDNLMEFDLSGFDEPVEEAPVVETATDDNSLDFNLGDMEIPELGDEEPPELEAIAEDDLPELELNLSGDLAELEETSADVDSEPLAELEDLAELDELAELDGLAELDDLPALDDEDNLSVADTALVEEGEVADDDAAEEQVTVEETASELPTLDAEPELAATAMPDLDELMDAGAGEFDLDSLDFDLDGLGENSEAPALSLDDLNRAMEWEADGSEVAAEAEPAELDLGDLSGDAELPELADLEDFAEADDLPELEAFEESELPELGAELTAEEADLADFDEALPELGELDEELPELGELAEELPELADLEEPAAADVDGLEEVTFNAADADDAIDLDELAETDDEFAYLSGTDASETKLDLARAYVDMGESDSARELLGEILQEGSDKQKQEAQSLLDSLS